MCMWPLCGAQVIDKLSPLSAVLCHPFGNISCHITCSFMYVVPAHTIFWSWFSVSLAIVFPRGFKTMLAWLCCFRTSQVCGKSFSIFSFLLAPFTIYCFENILECCPSQGFQKVNLVLHSWCMCLLWSTISDNNIGQWLPFPPYPLPNVVLQVQKKYRKKSRRHCSNIERGEAGEGFLLRVARDFWLGLYSLYMLGLSMGLFQACHVIDFQKDIIKTAKPKQTWTTTGNYQ